jgi:CDP-glucose 4,6-dehydratase
MNLWHTKDKHALQQGETRLNSKLWQGKSVLVTGGSGFVGRWLCRALADSGIDLHILDLVRPTSLDQPFTYHKTDLGQLDATIEMLRKTQPKVILHLAGLPGVGASHDSPTTAFTANVVATFNLLEGCRQLASPVESIVAVSSNHVYGEQHRQPIPEDAPLDGTGAYASTKLCSDVLARAYGKTYNLPVGIARMTNSFGGDDHHVTHIITATILSALAGKQPVIKQSGRDRKGYLYIKDTAQGLLAVAEGLMQKPELRGEAFNIVPDEAYTVVELVRAVSAATGLKLEPVVQNPAAEFDNEHLDNSKAAKLLGWKPRYPLAQGLSETIAWYREHPPAESKQAH